MSEAVLLRIEELKKLGIIDCCANYIINKEIFEWKKGT